MGVKRGVIWIGESSVYLGDDNIIYATPIGDIDEKTAIEFVDNILKFADMVDGKVNSLIGLDKAGKPSIKARKIGEDALKHEKVGKLAFYGLHPVSKMLASFAMGIIKKKDMRFFKTKEEALAWLKE